MNDGGCWIWTRYRSNGYGQFNYRGANVYAHREAYTVFVAPIPDGMHVCHSCDVPECVNPSHLFLGTNADNIRDSSEKGRRKGVARARPTGLAYRSRDESTDKRVKLRSADIADIYRRIFLGETKSSIARIYGVSGARIGQVWKERSR